MSARMMFLPDPDLPEPLGTDITGIKHLLARRFLDQDGSLSCDPFRLDSDVVPWLEGVADATPNEDVEDDARELIKAIREFGAVKVWISQ